jgi:hypothetical protein
MHAAAEHRAVGLHPSRRAPGRGQQMQVRIHTARLPQNGQDVSAVVIDGEAREVGVGPAFVEAVHRAAVVARADANASHAESHLGGMEHLVEQRRARRCSELSEHVAGGVGERSADAEVLLKRRLRIESDDAARRLARRGPPGKRFRGRKLAARVRHRHLNGACGSFEARGSSWRWRCPQTCGCGHARRCRLQKVTPRSVLGHRVWFLLILPERTTKRAWLLHCWR